jgi:ribosomal protein S27AE
VDWQVEEMNETCDRCGPAVRAAYRVDRVGELYLCGHCASQQWRALSAQGWTFWPLGVHALAPQAGYDQVEDAA